MARRTNTPSPNGLHSFEGREVIGTRVAVTNAGDGLSKAMSIDPTELALGSTVYVVLECETTRVGYEPVTDTGTLLRKHTLKAGTATLVDGALVADVLDAQKLAIERAAGVERLDFEGDGDVSD